MPLIVGVMAWIALGLRRPEVFQLAVGAPSRREAGLERQAVLA